MQGDPRTAGQVDLADRMLPISTDTFLAMLAERYHHELAHHGIHRVKRGVGEGAREAALMTAAGRCGLQG
jgi:hypothetical protein